ncbi:Peptidase A1 domain-containing protein [Aphelenchoides bicaudatus]|nr:Peptidase A1 domain-containing protein [Aphelenchoides bicaudatus]
MFPEHCQGRDGTPAPATSKTYNSAGRDPEPGFKATYDFTFNTQWGYKDALARGQFVEDTIWFGTPPNSVRVEEIRFGVADNIQMPDDFGILGLSARDDEEDTRTGTHFLSRLDDVLTHKMFTLFYQPGGGRITFGDYDPHNCGMVRSIVRVAPETINWQFRMDSFILNNEPLFGATDVISDSGSTDIHVPKKAFDTIMAAIGDVEYDPSINPLPHVSCNRVQNIRIKLMIGDMPYSLPVNALTERSGNNMCSIHIVPHSNDFPGKAWLLGAPWLRSYCQVHYFSNLQHPEIGFALINRHVGDGQYFH